MKRPEKNITADSTLTKPLSKNASGFTLIELLVVIAIIAVLIGLLLPAIQRTREEYAHNEARANVQKLIIASNEYFNRTGSYALDLNDLYLFCSTNPGRCSLDPQLATGKKNGYLYEIVEADATHCVIEAEPESPGIDGALTVRAQVALENTMVSSQVTAGADEAREQMFRNIRAKAAETVVKLLNLDGSATSQVRQYSASPDTISNVCNLLDADHNGSISINEIENHTDLVDYIDTDELAQPLAQFLNFVAQEMKWGSLSEEQKDGLLIDVIIAPINEPSAEPPLFSYDGLAILTRASITDGTSNTIFLALLGKLEEAETAEASGNQQGKMKAIKNYQKQLKALVGQSLTRSNSKMLITLSNTL
jgi:prepilin-type N-terminal cleavage/methylation domain-containing protein